MVIADGNGLPIGVTLHSGTRFETPLTEETIRSIPIDKKPEKLFGDRAYASLPLAQSLMENFEIELVAPIKANSKNIWQDRRKLRRYKRRWKIERL